MAYAINFIGHCHEGSHDKVWGYVTTSDGNLYNFWGKRGAKFTFQQQVGSTYASNRRLQRKAQEKCRAGRGSGTYREVPLDEVETIWPGFIKDLEMQLVYAKLANNFRYGAEEE